METGGADVIINGDDHLEHYGTKRHSGRYPWGSGGDENGGDFIGMVNHLRKQGLKNPEIAASLGYKSSTELIQKITIERNRQKLAKIHEAQKLKDRGWSNMAISRHMGINESSVRALLADGVKEKADVLTSTADTIRREMEKKQYIDIGSGVEYHMGVSREKLKAAVKILEDEGYVIRHVPVEQLGTGQKTNTLVIGPKGSRFPDFIKARDAGKIHQVMSYSSDGGRSFDAIQPPISVSSKRIKVNYAEEGGKDADGVIFVRPNVKELHLGNARYAQVRIAVDGSHYLKGMAMYRNDLPPGVDLVFNTNKSSTGNKLDAMKPMKVDKETGEIDRNDPFGSMISRQIGHPDPSDPTKKIVTSAMNIVNEEGDWGKWSRTLSSQFLSKQAPSLAKKQLEKTLEQKRKDFDEIMALTNPAVKKKLLESFAADADSSAVHLKAAALPKQATHVILPLKSIKETEVFAPNYDDGEIVVLVRFPHGGKFEIPELRVNNKNREGRELIGQHATDAIGINSKVAERLSGADFDGDTVLVIPNNDRKVQNEPALQQLRDFDPQSYKDTSLPKMKSKTKGVEMGKISNLITDMHVQKAPLSEIARAVRHSMVVIDAEKHQLDYKRSAIDHGISALTAKYQKKEDGTVGGASTLVSRSRSEVTVPDRKLRPQSKGGPIDPKTGELVYEYSGETYTQRKESKKTGKVTEKEVLKNSKAKSTQLAEAKDAHELSSGTLIEKIYADHSNNLKALANEARLAAHGIKSAPYSPSAARAYSEQVTRLKSALNLALRNSPLERQAQVIAGAIVRQKQQANNDMEKSELKKVKAKALEVARLRTGAHKERIKISPDEWAAIQAGAISNSMLEKILDNADLDVVKQLATPKEGVKMSSADKAKAIRLLNNNYTQAEAAKAIGISVSQLKRGLSDG